MTTYWAVKSVERPALWLLVVTYPRQTFVNHLLAKTQTLTTEHRVAPWALHQFKQVGDIIIVFDHTLCNVRVHASACKERRLVVEAPNAQDDSLSNDSESSIRS